MRDQHPASDTLNLLVDAYIRRWLVDTEMGRGIVERAPDPESAVSAVIDLLNAGYLKMIADRTGISGIEARFPPERPAGSLTYLRRQ